MVKDSTTEIGNPSTATATAAPGVGAASRAQYEHSFFGHPRGLSTLFFTEMWERFGYYGMRALLVLFMTAAMTDSNAGLGFSVHQAGAIYGLFAAFVYLLALPGGWVADKILGQRRAVLVGGIIIALGYYGMALPSRTTFYFSLVLVVLGTGLLKPNISTMVGELYPDRSPEGNARRDSGFTIFYMGINMGALLAPLVAGYVGQKISWHWGFATAGMGMTLGLLQYTSFGRYLGDAGMRPDVGDTRTLRRNTRNLAIGVGAVAVLAYVLLGVLHLGVAQIAGALGYVIAAMGLGYLAYVILFGGLTTDEKKRVAVIGLLFLAAAVFWSGFEQAGSSLNLVAEQLTRLNIFGWDMPASWLQSVNPAYIIVFAPMFAWLWVFLARHKLEPSAPLKFGLGLILLGAGFAVMIGAASAAMAGPKVAVWWLVATYFLHTCGELSLSPVGLSTMTKLAPHRMVGQMMGIWFMAASLGNLMAGLFASTIGAGAGTGEISASAAHSAFVLVTEISIAAGFLMVFISPWARKLMGDTH
jgi:POT family proton-dependent oligopeptide transporter